MVVQDAVSVAFYWKQELMGLTGKVILALPREIDLFP